MSLGFWLIAGLAAGGALVWTVRRFAGPSARQAVDDPDELEAAEREVRDLDVHVRPDEADEQLPDWGPGAGGR